MVRNRAVNQCNGFILLFHYQRKLVDYLLRQSRVEEEMKNVLKQYFKKKEITKEEYKNILKKAVPQVGI